MGELLEPVDRSLDLAHAAIVAEISSVDQQITLRYIVPLERVRIRETDNTNGSGVWWWKTRGTPEAEEELVDGVEEGRERGDQHIADPGAEIEGSGHDELIIMDQGEESGIPRF